MSNRTILILSNVSAGLVNFRNELLRELVKKYRVVVIAEDNGGKDKLNAIGCEFRSINLERHGINPLKEYKLYKAYKSSMIEIKPFVILTYTIKPNIYGGRAASELRIPFIANITGLGDAIENEGIISKIVKIMYKHSLKNATIVFFQNMSNQHYFVSHKIYNGNNSILPGSGVNIQTHCYEKYPEQDKRTKVVFSVIGRVTCDKGIREVLEASSHFVNSGIRIQIIGRCEGDYLEAIKKKEKEGVIVYVGQQDNIHEWIKKSHAILHASYHEGMSNVLLEAAATGRPVIATNVPGCIDTFIEGKSGIAFEPRNVDSLIAAIERFLLLPYDQKVKMGVEGRRKVEREFDRYIVVDKYMSQITKLDDYNVN